MKNLFHNNLVLVITSFLLLVVALAIVVINYLWVPDIFNDAIGVIGSFLFYSLLVLFAVAFFSVAYFLYNSRHGLLLIFSLLAITEVVYSTFLVRYAMTQQIRTYIQHLVDQTADLVTVEVETRLRFRLYALSRFSQDWDQSGQPTHQQWLFNAEQVLDFFPGFKAIEWVDADYKIRWVVPLAGNESVVGMDIRSTAQRRRMLERAKAKGEVTVIRAVDLAQGGRGFLVYVPLFHQQQFKGFIVGVVSYQSLFDVLFAPNVVPGHSIAAFVDHESIYQRGIRDPDLEKRWGHNVYLRFYGLPLRFKIWPNNELVSKEARLIPSMLLFMGLLVSLLVVMATCLVLMMQGYTERVEKTNKRLIAEMRERKQAERARKKMEQALQQSQKLEAIGTLAGGIAHNFNNILYSIKGYVGMARDDAGPDSQTRKNLSKVLEAATRGQDLVKGILSFSRHDSYELEPLVLSDVIHGSLDLLRSTLPATTEINACIELHDERVKGNHTQLQQVLMNIIRNGADAMDQLGVMDISAAKQGFYDVHQERHHQAYLVIKIRDRGTGMDEETCKRIFEPFFTTKDIDKGTGLGLATSLSIIKEHGGEIVVESVVGQGTTFMILLPELKAQNHKESKDG